VVGLAERENQEVGQPGNVNDCTRGIRVHVHHRVIAPAGSEVIRPELIPAAADDGVLSLRHRIQRIDGHPAGVSDPGESRRAREAESDGDVAARARTARAGRVSIPSSRSRRSTTAQSHVNASVSPGW